MLQREVHGKRRLGRHTSNMTPRNGNIAKGMGENVEVILRDTRDLAIDGEHWCEVLHHGRADR